MPRRRADKKDGNQDEIVEALEKLGFSVETGKDDILVGKHNRTWWFELKTPECRSNKTGLIRPSAKKDSQIKLEAEFKGQYDIVCSLDEILAIINK